MAEAAEAVARLRLDATGFDKQANSSFREFSKQLTSVKDATDAAMRGAEALQKVFVKTLGGTLVIGAAGVLADAIRDLGTKIGATGQAAAKAIDQLQAMGDPKTFSEAVSQSAGLLQNMTGIKEELAKIESNPMTKFLASISGARGEMQELAKTMQRIADSQLALGMVAEARTGAFTSSMSKDDRDLFEISQRTRARVASTSQIKDLNLRQQAIEAAYEIGARERNAKLDEIAAKTRGPTDSAGVASAKLELRGIEAGLSGAAAAEQIGVKFDQERAAYKASESERIKRLNEERARMAAEDQNLNTMQIVQAQEALLTAEEQKRQIDKRVIETDAAASKIAQGIFGSARGPGQRMTSTEIGINRAVERAFNQTTLKSSQEYRDQIKKELGAGADGYAVNREIQRRRVKDAEEKARAPFDAAKEAKDRASNLEKYMQHVQDVLNELKAYAHAT
jgi:hypothetical protein